MVRDGIQLRRAASVLRALGNPYRMQIIALLSEGEQNVTQINQRIPISQPSLSQHLSRLKREGVLEARRERREIFYSIKGALSVNLVQLAVDATRDGAHLTNKAVAQRC
jgi:DNA-binding transcriptional ArsR family regulator